VETAPRPATRPTRADGRRNYDALLAAARNAFEAKGAAVSMEEIAQGAGVAIGTLYGHFGTRESLVEAATRDGLAALITHGERVADELGPLPALREWLHHAVEFCSTYRGMVAILTQGIHDETSHWHAGCQAMERCGAQLLASAQSAGEVRAEFTPGELFDVVSAAAWVRENAPRERDSSSRLLEVFLDGVTRAPSPIAARRVGRGRPRHRGRPARRPARRTGARGPLRGRRDLRRPVAG
jgi:AcrR family transcriptional regulator